MFLNFKIIEGQQQKHEEQFFQDEDNIDAVQIEFKSASAMSQKDSVFVTILSNPNPNPKTGEVKGDILCLHGIDGYGHFWPKYSVRGFLDAGYRVFIPDLPSWGRTAALSHPESFGYIADMNIYSKCIDQLINELIIPSLKEDKKPLFLCSISLGGMHVVNYLFDHQSKGQVDGCIFVSPALALARESIPSPLLVASIRTLLYLFPSMGSVESPNGGVKGNICPDPQFEVDFFSDPLNYRGNVKMGTGRECLDSFARMEERMAKISVPFLILHGSLDRATCPAGSDRLFESSQSTDKSFISYENVEHIIFHERPGAVQDVVDWMDLRMDGSKTISTKKTIAGPRWKKE